jgi:alanine racemase
VFEVHPAAPAVLTIDLDAVVANWRRIAAEVAPASAAAVVKADAYGLGARQVVPVLVAAGCAHFFVAHQGEAEAIRDLVPDDALLAVLNGLHAGGEAAAAAMGITPVLNSVGQARRWQAQAERLGRALPALLQVDTGMARHGLAPDEVLPLAQDEAFRRAVPLVAVMSHLACSDEPDHRANADQAKAFAALAQAFPNVPRCFANSGGALLGKAFHGDLVRPGLALYGAEPADGRGEPFAPVVQLQARVVQTRVISAGTPVGYGHSWQAAKPTRLATLSIGYADGFPRSLSNRGAAWAQGHVLPIVGRVSMDVTVVDISALSEGALAEGALAEGALAEGDLVEIIGPHRPIEQVAQEAGTIAYELLTQLGHRYQRIYTGGCISAVDR